MTLGAALQDIESWLRALAAPMRPARAPGAVVWADEKTVAVDHTSPPSPRTPAAVTESAVIAVPAALTQHTDDEPVPAAPQPSWHADAAPPLAQSSIAFGRSAPVRFDENHSATNVPGDPTRGPASEPTVPRTPPPWAVDAAAPAPPSAASALEAPNRRPPTGDFPPVFAVADAWSPDVIAAALAPVLDTPAFAVTDQDQHRDVIDATPPSEAVDVVELADQLAELLEADSVLLGVLDHEP